MTTPTLALLVDAENIPPKHADTLFATIADIGDAPVRRAYGDWTEPNLKGWKSVLHDHALQPIQQFTNTSGKNASDGALIIDAMDLLHSRRFTAFCIVSSDGDFTRLATRLREDGLAVYGFGEAKTPRPFVRACTRFIHLDAGATPPVAPQPRPPAAPLARETAAARDATLADLFRTAHGDVRRADAWADFAAFGSAVAKRRPGFSTKAHGFARLSDLVAATGCFEIDRSTANFRLRPRPAKSV